MKKNVGAGAGNKARIRTGHLQRSLDLALEDARKLRREARGLRAVMSRVAESVANYPDRLPQPQSVPGGVTDGQYAYLLECMRAELGYQADLLARLVEGVEVDSDLDPVYVTGKTSRHI
jgi:hypothetical protein